MRRIVGILLLAALVACSSDGPTDATKAACAKWNAIQGTQASDDMAVEVLREIVDLGPSKPVADHATELSIALETDAASADVHDKFLDMDAACQVAVGD